MRSPDLLTFPDVITLPEGFDRRGRYFTCPPHDFQPTGRRGQHAGLRCVTYLRCPYCRQDGYRYDGSKVIYTWRLDP